MGGVLSLSFQYYFASFFPPLTCDTFLATKIKTLVSYSLIGIFPMKNAARSEIYDTAW